MHSNKGKEFGFKIEPPHGNKIHILSDLIQFMITPATHKI